MFTEEQRKRADGGLSNRWIIKPAQGTRGLGHNIVSDTTSRGAKVAAAFAPTIADEKLLALSNTKSAKQLLDHLNVDLLLSYDKADRVAQLLVDQPLLVNNRKFDVRYFVFIRSFEPFEGD